MNPEQLLEEIATAIKHRTISTTFKWHVVYYHYRVTCVPTYVNVPPEIILCEFSEKDVQQGLKKKSWTELSRRIVEIYKELHK